MKIDTKGTQGRATGPGAQEKKSTAKNANDSKLGKEYAQLLRFVGGESQNRFDAERLGDHCLHTTVSDLQRGYGIRFCRKRERVPTRFGKPVTVCRYWLDVETRVKLADLLRPS